MEGYTFIDKVENFEDGDMDNYKVNGYDILLSCVSDDFYAVEAICTHEYAELVDGDLEDYFVTCPLHFACFDVRDGSVKDPPATKSLQTFDVRVENNLIWISNNPEEVRT